ncbi:unnamed protein product [Clavelina lepadiformis]|uniref:Uncharacterized protein n=1 Tax=Clavelina lepadiformis TaxID=159417 RepID=A0ABP0GFQ4_CLALP
MVTLVFVWSDYKRCSGAMATKFCIGHTKLTRMVAHRVPIVFVMIGLHPTMRSLMQLMSRSVVCKLRAFLTIFNGPLAIYYYFHSFIVNSSIELLLRRSSLFYLYLNFNWNFYNFIVTKICKVKTSKAIPKIFKL